MTAFVVWLVWTLIVFGGGVWCGWECLHPLVDSFEVEVMRRRLRIMQQALDAERAMWRDAGRTGGPGRRR
jgi:polyferredoxin